MTYQRNCVLTKDQRDQHIRRYAELVEEARAVIVPHLAEQLRVKPGRPVSIVTEVAKATGLSVDTVRRALNPAPRAPQESKPVVEPARVVILPQDAAVLLPKRGPGQPKGVAREVADATGSAAILVWKSFPQLPTLAGR